MKLFYITASFLAISLAAAAPAMAQGMDESAPCRTLSKSVNTALSSASGDVSEARSEQRMGQVACASGFYKNGAAHYQKALTLLGK